MNTIQSLTKLTRAVETMAKYSAEDYQETATAVAEGLHRARIARAEETAKKAKEGKA